MATVREQVKAIQAAHPGLLSAEQIRRLAQAPPEKQEQALTMLRARLGMDGEDAAAAPAAPEDPFAQARPAASSRPPVDPASLRHFQATGAPVDVELSTNQGPMLAPVHDRLAAAGIQTQGEPFPEARRLQAFAADPAQRIAATEQALARQFGREVPVRGPSVAGSDEIEFVNPETNEIQTVNPAGFDIGDAAGAVPDVAMLGVEFLAEIAAIRATGGATGAGARTRAVGTQIGAGSAGAFVSNLARLYLGKAQGINQDLTWDQAWKDSLAAAGYTAGGGTAAVALQGIGHKLKRYAQGQHVSRDTMAQIQRTLAEGNDADTVVKELNRILDGAAEFEPTLAMRVGSASLLRHQAALRALEPDIADLENQIQAAVNTAFGKLEQGSAPGRFALGERAQKAVAAHMAGARRRAEGRLPEIRAAASEFARDLDVGDQLLIGGRIQGILEAERSAINKQFEDEYAELAERTGDLKVRMHSTRSLGEAQRGNVKSAVFQAFMDLEKRLFAQPDGTTKVVLSEGEERVAQLRASALKVPVEDVRQAIVDEKVLHNSIFDSKAEFDFRDVQLAVAKVNKLIRQAQKENADTGLLKSVKKSLIEDRNRAAAGNPVLLEQLQSLDQRYLESRRVFNDGVVKRILHKEERRDYAMGGENVVRSVFFGGVRNRTNAMELYDAIGHNPEAVAEVKRGIWAEYHRRVYRDGPSTADMPNADLHKRFLRDYGDNLRPFFTKAEYDELSRLGGFADAIKRMEQHQAETLRKLDKSLPGKWEDLRPQRLFENVWGQENIGEIREFRRIVGRDSDTMKGFKAEVFANMRSKVTTNGRLSLSKMNSYLDGHRGALKELFGERYVKDLDTVRRALDIAQRRVEAPKPSTIPALMHIARAYVGLFTTPGRFLTAAQRIKAKAANKMLTESLMNPTELRQLVELNRVSVDNQRAMALMSTLGASEFWMVDQRSTAPTLPYFRAGRPVQ